MACMLADINMQKAENSQPPFVNDFGSTRIISAQYPLISAMYVSHAFIFLYFCEAGSKL